MRQLIPNHTSIIWLVTSIKIVVGALFGLRYNKRIKGRACTCYCPFGMLYGYDY